MRMRNGDSFTHSDQRERLGSSLSHEKNPGTPRIRGYVDTRNGLNAGGKRQTFYPWSDPVISPRSSSPQASCYADWDIRLLPNGYYKKQVDLVMVGGHRYWQLQGSPRTRQSCDVSHWHRHVPFARRCGCPACFVVSDTDTRVFVPEGLGPDNGQVAMTSLSRRSCLHAQKALFTHKSLTKARQL